jgi:hypothetical protein
MLQYFQTNVATYSVIDDDKERKEQYGAQKLELEAGCVMNGPFYCQVIYNGLITTYLLYN